jgi:hypothetical protein
VSVHSFIAARSIECTVIVIPVTVIVIAAPRKREGNSIARGEDPPRRRFAANEVTLFSLDSKRFFSSVSEPSAYVRHMAYDAPEFLTRDQFISLLMVGDVTPSGLAPIIPIDHETLLVRLGYVVNLQGRLRITTHGRLRLASIEAAPGAGKTQTRPLPRSN